jgi:drug/metabolite transporter (DMT)-like permease
VASRQVYVALLLVQLFFATLPVAVKVALRELSSPAIALLRVSFAAAFLFVLHRVTVGERVRGRGDYLRLAVYGVFGVVLNQLLYITALTMTTATAAQTVMVAGPAVTLLVAILLGRETGSRAKWTGIALAGAGALSLVGVGLGTGGALGNLLALLNVSAYSVYLVISRDLLRRYQPLTVVTWIFVFGALGILPWGIGPVIREVGSATAETWLAIAWMVVFPTVVSYWLSVYALARVESSLVSAFTYLQPVLTAFLAIPLLRERPSPLMLPAALLIFAGVLVTIRAERRARRARARVPSPSGQPDAEGGDDEEPRDHAA